VTVENFFFEGAVPPSKSEWIRALVLQSYQPTIQIEAGENLYALSEDVRAALNSIQAFHSGKYLEMDVGSSAAAFRFLALRVSRTPGCYRLRMSPSLVRRPHQALFDIFSQLSVVCRIEGGVCEIKSNGWLPRSSEITVPSQNSSQFLSAFFLNTVNLEKTLWVKKNKLVVSEPYFLMTLRLLRKMGIKIEESESFYSISASQKLRPQSVRVSADFSSAFPLAAFAGCFGKSVIHGLTAESDQADQIFIELLSRMGVRVSQNRGAFIFQAPEHPGALRGISQDLGSAPDLFPVLASVCAFSEGRSVLSGAHHLIHKESNRIQKMSDLFSLLGVSHQARGDGMEIEGSPALLGQKKTYTEREIIFDPADDHRIAMAASLFTKVFPGLRILNPECVSKSFPGYWELIR